VSRFAVAFTTGLGGTLGAAVRYPGAGPLATVSLEIVDLTEIIQFDEPLDFDLDAIPSDAVLAELNGDAFLDLAVTLPTLDQVLVLLSTQDGGGAWAGFEASAAVSVGDAPSAIVAATIDGDASIDLAVTNAGVGTVTVLLNSGTEEMFERLDTVAFGAEPSDLAASVYETGPDSFDAGGTLDLAVANLANGTISILLGDGKGMFAPQPPILVGNQPTSIAADEFDGGPGLDLLVAIRNPDPQLNGMVRLLAGDGNGSFAFAGSAAVGRLPSGFDPEDIDNDKRGLVDAVVADAGSGGVTIILNRGGGTLVALPSLPVDGTPTSIVAFDMDGDADKDLAVAVSVPGAGRVVRVFRNDVDQGALAFVHDSDQAEDLEPILVVAGDVDADEQPDLVAISGITGASAGGGTTISGVLLNASHNACTGDVDDSGEVGFSDLLDVLSQWGACPPIGICPSDVNDDDDVGFADLLAVLSGWGPCA
jgi:hypothetical protein